MTDEQPTLYLSPRYTPDSVAIWRQGIADGWIVERLQTRTQRPTPKSRAAAVYGEPFFAREVAASMSMGLLEPPFEWLTTLPYACVNRKIIYTTLAQGRMLTSPMFVKPADDKCFDAQVYQSGADLPGDDHLDGSAPILISEPVTWISEFRCFVLDGEVVTLSVYLRDGELADGEEGKWPATETEFAEARAFASLVLSTVDLPPAVVLDIGVIDGVGWSVVEANPAWGAGIYGCDPGEVLKVLGRSCIPVEALTVDDARWVIGPKLTGA